MIDESGPWRQELVRIAQGLHKRAHLGRWAQRTYFLVERDVMYGAFVIRKLIESEKSSSLLPGRRVSVVLHPLIGRVSNPLDRWEVAEFFDITKPQKSEVDVATLCNEVVHSFVFQIFLDDSGQTSVAICSDRTRRSHLYVADLDVLADLFDYVGREDVVLMHGTMRDGVASSDRRSNHDLVEAGTAAYGDETRTWTNWNGS